VTAKARHASKPIRLTVMTMTGTIFRDAIRHGYIRINACVGVELPKVVKVKVEPPDKTEVRALLDQSAPETRTIFLLDAMTGLRRGEVLALKWRDIDWLNEEVLVERSICKARANDGAHKYGYGVGTTKTGKSRWVGLSPMVLTALKNHHARSENASAEDFIFNRNGTFIDPEYFSKSIELPLIKKVTKGRGRFHDLRHFFVSMLIEQGESPKYIQDQVGHADIKTTFNTYGHLMPQAKRAATAKLEKSLFGDDSPANGTPSDCFRGK
jgi:integrase